jgi:hypothetical protein
MVTDLLDDVYLWVLVLLIVAAAVVVGRIRGQTPLAVAMTAIGVIAVLIGMKLLSDLGARAFLGAALITGGFAILVEAMRRRGPQHPPGSK